MSAYSIMFDPGTSILEVKVEGFFEDGDMARFAAEFLAERERLRATGIRFGILGDGTLFSVQTQGVAQTLTKLVDAQNQQNRAPVAAVAGSALLRMQISRSMAAPHVRVFAERAEAVAWLEEQIAVPSNGENGIRRY